jgi:hypothetical protein
MIAGPPITGGVVKSMRRSVVAPRASDLGRASISRSFGLDLCTYLSCVFWALRHLGALGER